MIEIFTDGGCHGNPGPGAWAALLRYKGIEREISGYSPETTNNRMELTATIEALKSLRRSQKIYLYTDSQYVQKGVTQWLDGWRKRGWKTANNKPVKNQDLWQILHNFIPILDVEWYWVKGHSGHLDNERVDALVQKVLFEHSRQRRKAHSFADTVLYSDR